MPMGLYPLRVKILQSGNKTHLVHTLDEEDALTFPDRTDEDAPTTQASPSPAAPHHRSDIPPEDAYIGVNKLERPDTQTGTLSTPSSIPSSRSAPTVSSPDRTNTTLPVPSRPPYTTVRVTNRWVEETLAKVKTVVDSILKSIGSAESSLDEKNSNNISDGEEVNSVKMMGVKKSIVKRRKAARGGYKEERKERRYSSNEEQRQIKEFKENRTRREGIEIGISGNKRSSERRKKWTQGKRIRTEREKGQITFESSADKEADGKEGNKSGRGGNTGSLWNEHISRERKKLQTDSEVISTTETNKRFSNDDTERENPSASYNKVQVELIRLSKGRKNKLILPTSTAPSRHSFERSSVSERESIKRHWMRRDGGGRIRERGKAFPMDSEEIRKSNGYSVLLSAISREEGIAEHRGGRRVRDNSDIVHSIRGSKDFSNEKVFIFKRNSVLDSEEVNVGSQEKLVHRNSNVDSGSSNDRSLEMSSTSSTPVSSNVNSGKDGNEVGSHSGALAPKQTISSVTDLLFTVPNERIIRPAQNSQVQNEIKSTEKLIRTSLEDLLFRVPPVGSRQAQEKDPGLKTPVETKSTDAITTTAKNITALPRGLISPDDTGAPSVDTDTKTVTGRKPADRDGLIKRARKEKTAGGEVPHDTIYQRKNITEKKTKKTERLANAETETESQEEAGDLILRTACLPVGSIGRFKVEGVTYLVTGIGAGARAEDCWREVTNVVNRHIRLPAINHTTLLATTAFYFVAASANLIGECKLLYPNRRE